MRHRVWGTAVLLVAGLAGLAGCGDDGPGHLASPASAPATEVADDGALDLGGVDPAEVEITDDDQGLVYQDVGAAPSPEGFAAANDAVASGRLLNVDEPGSGLQVLHDLAFAERTGSESPGRRPVANTWLGWPALTPGGTVDIPVEGDTGACTLAFVGTRAGEPVALTAGHCVEGADGELGRRTGPRSATDTVGPLLASQNRDRSLDDGLDGVTDYALAGIGPEVPVERRVAGRYEVSRVLRPDELHPGMELCSFGFRTEETCGPVIASNATMVRAVVFSLGGDSGSPAYVRLDGTHVAAVGILSGSPVVDGELSDDVTDFALLAPVLDHTGVTVPG